ncbi:bifunctional aspartate kinase/homoserine dehydrogenase I [Rhodohalobacter mucosus]|uniref:Bifunctional aspartate kinase/homoserine dehydrogenase I n=1 Tax=Rhodohalobacter mucosus TaxID=2079485 RepID=A0A316TXQ8_9BACT|nr:bifunctional aspartate kinase/homoserine dehydrogenase I [Rhodohalobacter mucosus]PWN08115.1 bifunctional aspartate kinase/homoserine dehydrogenase I [Rhodohalobacter mucosus]
MKVLKFGGSSVGSPEALENVFSIISKEAKSGKPPVVVVSAFRGVTDQLFEIADLAAAGNRRYRDILEEMDARHLTAIRKLVPASHQTDVITRFKITFNELEDVLQGVALTCELTAKTLDFIVGFGERFCALILASMLNTRGVSALYSDTRKLIKTDEHFGMANVLTAPTYRNIASHIETNSETVIVATGFIASTERQESTTLGRGGSDYTASLFGAALSAEMVEIWTDVDGLMTADPGKVQRAFPVSKASYEEAMELSHFGAKVIYPPTIQPALKSGIPIAIKNTFKPEHPGTLISDQATKTSGIIRGISSIDEIALISIKGTGMIGVSGVASRIFNALARKKINIILITQSSSEHTVTIAVLPADAGRAKMAIADEFAGEVESDAIDEIKVETDLSVIAVVGDNMRQIPGIAGRVFNALGRNGINIVAIAQGSSERNISFVVDQENERKAMNTLHDAFFLAGVKSVNLFVVGLGLIGGRLLEMLAEQAKNLFDDYQIEINLKGIANSNRMLVREESIPLDMWQGELEKEGYGMKLERFALEVKKLNLPNSIFVDCTASGDIQRIYPEFLKKSISVVTPNKLANSSNQELFDELQKMAFQHNCAYRYETNVGAGLPLIGTMHELVTTGDHVERIEGVLSGTLSYIFNNFDGSVPFSDIVREARKKGYTEPDPREDLNGHDVGRKLLILARVAGYKLEFEDIEIENLVPEGAMEAESTEDFFEALKKYDSEFESLRLEAEKKDKKLCYIARFDGGKPTVVLEKIDKDHPFYNLSGSDNIVALYTRHYNEHPMVIQGPGAGADVTAGGIIADILRVTNTKVFNNAGS